MFNFIEHDKILNTMTLKEREILGYALEVLKKNLLMPDDIIFNEKVNKDEFDAVIQIMNIDFLCLFKENITSANFNTTLKLLAV